MMPLGRPCFADKSLPFSSFFIIFVLGKGRIGLGGVLMQFVKVVAYT